MTRPRPAPAPTSPTPEQLDMVLESLRAGIPFGWAASSARLNEATVRAAAKSDDAFAARLEEAEAEGGAQALHAMTHSTTPIKAPFAPVSTPDRDASPLDPERVAWEAQEHAPGPFGYLLWLDAKLVAHGFPAMSPWWRYDLQRFYDSGKRWGVYSVGRGGAKSTTLVRVAACESLFAPREVPPGQRWVWPFISVSTTDAKRRIIEIAAILRAVGLDVEPKSPNGVPTIELVDLRGNPIAFMSLASTIAATSGPSCNGATIDEEAKLRNRTTNANPATEILASLLQTFRARAGVRAIRCSSAWTTDGSHAQAIVEGDTLANHIGRIGEPFFADVFNGLIDVAQWEDRHGDATAAQQIRAHATKLTADSPAIPTWLGNPTISAVASREEIEAMPREALGGISRVTYWLRENVSVPLAPSALKSSDSTVMSEDELRAWTARQRSLAAGHAGLSPSLDGLSHLPSRREERYPGDPLATVRGYRGPGDDSL